MCLLTLTGPGEIGKTRLGLQLAAALSDKFTDGVFFVPLAPITDPMLVISTVAQTLGVHDRGSQSIFETLREFLSPIKILLFLDSFEHVCEAASEVAQLDGSVGKDSSGGTVHPARTVGEIQFFHNG